MTKLVLLYASGGALNENIASKNQVTVDLLGVQNPLFRFLRGTGGTVEPPLTGLYP